MVELIKKKRNGIELTREEFSEIIAGYIDGSIPDYQLSALLMAIYFKGCSSQETADLTDVMMRSGQLIDLSELKGIKVDKHSTGGVGDKTTIVLAPLVAAAGAPVAKMSGRGLGHTGGTIDKLESIKGFSVNLTRKEFIDNIKKHGIAVCGQNEHLVPADKKIYALRDVTGTVDSFALIASSIMSKKLACGADAIVIDLKVGSGAYMKTEADADKLAKLLIDIGSRMNRKVIAVITAMEEPLGLSIGNALEVKEAIDTLKGNGPKDLTNLVYELGSNMLLLSKVVKTAEEGVQVLKQLIDSGKALEKLKEFVEAQGGDTKYIDQPELLPSAKFKHTIKADKNGYLHELNALKVGLASVKLGAGRETKASAIDLGAGIILSKKMGDKINVGDTIATLYTNDKSNFESALRLMDNAIKINDQEPTKMPLILKTIR